MIHIREEPLNLRRICTYEANKSLRTVSSSFLRLYRRIYYFACYHRSWFHVCLLRRYRLQITTILKIDTLLISILLIFDECLYVYTDYYLEIILITNLCYTKKSKIHSSTSRVHHPHPELGSSLVPCIAGLFHASWDWNNSYLWF